MVSNNPTYPAARAVTTGPRHHFFGYYDKFPWDKSGRYLLGLETTFIDRPPSPNDCATIGLIDLADNCLHCLQCVNFREPLFWWESRPPHQNRISN